MKTEEQNLILIEALKEIANPIKAMENKLKPGENLDGQMAILLSKDAAYLKSIAHAALHKANIS